MKTLERKIIEFELPSDLACPEPTEERGLARDEVRMLVTREEGNRIDHEYFSSLVDYLSEGDVLVVNTSGIIPAAVDVVLPGGDHGVVHFSNRITNDKWLVEIREVVDQKSRRWKSGELGMIIDLPGNGQLILQKRFHQGTDQIDLWHCRLELSQDINQYLHDYGRPIKYEKLNREFPLAYYTTLFAHTPGSSEMLSASRGFTNRLVQKLLDKGVLFAPILLHSGISSLEDDELPYPEYVEVDPVTIAIINHAKRNGKKIIAVGTTAIRAIESAVTAKQELQPYRGQTNLFIDSTYQLNVVNGLITGFHEPKASHLHILQALAGYEHIDNAYLAALEGRYYWHEFGDLHLILP